MRDETLDPRALSIPANSMAIYPAPTTATFLKKKKIYTVLCKSNANGIRRISLFVLTIFRRKFERKFDRKFEAS